MPGKDLTIFIVQLKMREEGRAVKISVNKYRFIAALYEYYNDYNKLRLDFDVVLAHVWHTGLFDFLWICSNCFGSLFR